MFLWSSKHISFLCNTRQNPQRPHVTQVFSLYSARHVNEALPLTADHVRKSNYSLNFIASSSFTARVEINNDTRIYWTLNLPFLHFVHWQQSKTEWDYAFNYLLLFSTPLHVGIINTTREYESLSLRSFRTDARISLSLPSACSCFTLAIETDIKTRNSHRPLIFCASRCKKTVHW